MKKIILSIIISIVSVFGAAEEQEKEDNFIRHYECDYGLFLPVDIKTVEGFLQYARGINTCNRTLESDFPLVIKDWVKVRDFFNEDQKKQIRQGLRGEKADTKTLRETGIDIFDPEYDDVFTSIEFGKEISLGQICQLLRQENRWLFRFDCVLNKISRVGMKAIRDVLPGAYVYPRQIKMYHVELDDAKAHALADVLEILPTLGTTCSDAVLCNAKNDKSLFGAISRALYSTHFGLIKEGGILPSNVLNKSFAAYAHSASCDEILKRWQKIKNWFDEEQTNLIRTSLRDIIFSDKTLKKFKIDVRASGYQDIFTNIFFNLNIMSHSRDLSSKLPSLLTSDILWVTNLNLVGAHLNLQQSVNLANALPNSQLTHLSMGDVWIGSLETMFIVLSACKSKISHLDLQHPHLMKPERRVISANLPAPTMMSLNLGSNFDDEDIQMIACNLKGSNLEQLGLMMNPFADIGALALAQVIPHSSLKKLSVGYKVSKDMRDQLKQLVKMGVM